MPLILHLFQRFESFSRLWFGPKNWKWISNVQASHMNLNCDQPKTKTQDPKEDRIERREAKNVNIFLPELFHVFPILIWSIYILFGIFKLVTFFGHISHWPIRPKDHSSGYLSVSHSFIPVPGLFPCLSVCVCLWVRVKWLKWIQPRLSYEGAAVGKLPHTYGKIWYPIFFEIPRRFARLTFLQTPYQDFILVKFTEIITFLIRNLDWI